MTRAGIEPRSPGLLANTLTARPMDQSIGACIYSPILFIISETSTNKQLLSILEVLLIKKKYKSELCIQKQSYSLLLFHNLLRPSEEKHHEPYQLCWLTEFYKNMFFFTPAVFFFGYNPILTFAQSAGAVEYTDCFSAEG